MLRKAGIYQPTTATHRHGSYWLLPVFAVLLLIGGCAAASIGLSKSEVESFRLEKVEVLYAEEPYLRWDKPETEYVEQARARAPKDAKSKPWKQVMPEDIEAQKNEYLNLIESAEGRSHVRGRLSTEIRTRLTAALTPRLRGARPVVVEVTVKRFIIPSAVERVIIGGAPTFHAVTVVKDAKTGAVLAQTDRPVSAFAGNGWAGVLADQAFSDLDDRLFRAYESQLAEWLTVT